MQIKTHIRLFWQGVQNILEQQYVHSKYRLVLTNISYSDIITALSSSSNQTKKRHNAQTLQTVPSQKMFSKLSLSVLVEHGMIFNVSVEKIKCRQAPDPL